MYKKAFYMLEVLLEVKICQIISFYSLGWNKLILHHKYGGGGRI